MALCVSAPAAAREHILRAAARQFTAGDVQHWWLPTTGQGIKTRISDNRIWLAYVVARYLEVTEDFAVLDEQVPFLAGGPLRADQQEEFAAPAAISPASLFEHCVRALDCSLAIGTHGLPLFGAGDWNDGMNRVGADGRGESVWLGWFLHTTLLRFAPLAEKRGDDAKAADWRKHAFALQQAIEREAWDGDWYRRGYFDDGTPLGSVTSDECKIDSIAQSWAIISGAGELGHATRAMAAVNAQLVSRSDGLIKLFTPPFDHTPHDPGYIKAYPPGLRENGGQYTHAAVWSVLAYAMLGNGRRVVLATQSHQPCQHAREHSPLQGRTLCGVCGRVQRPRSCRQGRLDVVHRIRRMDVPRRYRSHSRHQSARPDLEHRSLHAARVERLRTHLQAWQLPLSHRGKKPPRHSQGQDAGDSRWAGAAGWCVRIKISGRRPLSLRESDAGLVGRA
jgi:cyclic beta-1,2-glucan synthetase